MKFYPTLETYFKLNETESIKKAPPKGKIEDCKVIYAPDGQEIDMKHLNTEIDAAKTAIVTQSPLYSPYINYLTQIYTFGVDTMATDGERLFINPQFAFNLSWEEMTFVLLHEMMHCILMHMQRKGQREHKLFNIAADHEINTTLVETVRVDGQQVFSKKTVDGLRGIYDKKYLGKPAEEIYADLEKNPPPNYTPDGQTKRTGHGGIPEDEDQQGGGGKGQPPPVQVGTKVRIKATGEIGRVTNVNPDGTFDVEEIPAEDAADKANESFYPTLESILNEQRGGTFKRDEIVPIYQNQGGSGGGGGGEIEGEYEIEGEGESEGEGQGGGGKPGRGTGGDSPGGPPSGKPGTGVTKDGKEVSIPVTKPSDYQKGKKGKGKGDGDGDGGDGEGGKPGEEKERKLDTRKGQAPPPETGGMITRKEGDQLAKDAGWDIEETREDSEDAVRADWKKAATDLYKRAKTLSAGSGVGGILTGILGPLVAPKVDWKEEFKRFIGSALSQEKEWRLGNRRHTRYEQKVIRYGRKPMRNALNKIAVLVDTSGSMDHKWIKEILNEIAGMIMTKQVQSVTVVFFDGEVAKQHIKVLKNANDLITQIPDVPGGGGTNFQNPLNWVEKNMPLPNLVVMCTDGGAPMPKKPTYSGRFIWALWGSIDEEDFEEKVGWGKVIKIEPED